MAPVPGGRAYVRINGRLDGRRLPIVFIHGGPGGNHAAYLDALALADREPPGLALRIQRQPIDARRLRKPSRDHRFTFALGFEDLLAEARGYRLSLCLAHQNLAQLPRGMADALSANARTKLIFTCSPEDARVLARHSEPYLKAYDLCHLDAHQVACRLVVAGKDGIRYTLDLALTPDG